ncbi:MAG: hypothetical protein ACPGVK_06110 [Halocynthiibacter sp.]
MRKTFALIAAGVFAASAASAGSYSDATVEAAPVMVEESGSSVSAGAVIAALVVIGLIAAAAD